jgi:uncharacterized protein YjbI with pentapeptide repeats
MAHDQVAPWELCGHDGCIGVPLVTAVWCFRHAATRDPPAFEAELKRISEDGNVDARGVHLSTELLQRILEAAPHEGNRPILKTALFDKATFQGGMGFDRAIFQGEATFDNATFQGEVRFSKATFQSKARFYRAVFRREAAFGGVTFEGEAWFGATIFQGIAWFNGACFQDVAGFNEVAFQDEARFSEVIFQSVADFDLATFQSEARFGGTNFQDETWFNGTAFQGEAFLAGARFERARQIGPLLARQLVLDGAVFSARVQLEVAAAAVCARRTQFPAGVRFRLRWASVILDDADLAAPASLAGVPPFPNLREQEAARRWQRLPPGPRAQRWRPRLLSLCRADVAGLRLNNVDLQACRFNGAHNLDKLRIEGEPLLARTRGWWRARRKTLAEEQQWRASRPGRWRPGGWYPRACQPPASIKVLDPHASLAPVHLAALYRELRKAREDAKDEPGAADFYYGEMELRRHNRGAPLAERLVLWLYWLVSGYGLRGLRALAWLAVAVIALAALLQSVGFNGGDPPFRDVLIYAAQSTVSVVSGNKALTDHMSWAGEVLRIILRLVGPLLLGLALLAVRNRVKR